MPTCVLVGFGGPESPSDVTPFIERVLAGRRAPPGRVATVAAQYAIAGGTSGYNPAARELRDRLADAVEVPVVLGYRNAAPFLPDILSSLDARAIVAVSLTPFGGGRGGDGNRRAYEALEDPRPVQWVDGWYRSNGLIRAWADRLKGQAGHVVMTAHSVPIDSADEYAHQVEVLATQIAAAAGLDDWSIAWQSRSGKPSDPWLGPDVCELIQEVDGPVVVAPIGFLFSNMEVEFDLGVEARAAATKQGLEFTLIRPPSLVDGLVADLAGRISALV